jgi:hypothetical protein
LSEYFEKVYDFLVGTVVLRLIRAVMAPLAVSIPSDKGATLRRSRSCVFSNVLSERMAAWTAPQYATASSGVDGLVGLFAIEEFGYELYYMEGFNC